MRTTMPVFVLIAVLASMATGCSGGTNLNPASPTETTATEEVFAGQTSVTTLAAPVGLTGIVRNVNTRARSFTLATRSGSRLVRTDENTQVWSSGTRVRFTTVREGMTVGVRAQDYGRFLLARTISIRR